jgi:hypothetical protein
MLVNYYWLLLFCFFIWIFYTDQSVAKAFYMLTQLIRVEYEKIKWWILYNPRNPIVKYLMWKKSMRLAKELMDELESKNKPK